MVAPTHFNVASAHQHARVVYVHVVTTGVTKMIFGSGIFNHKKQVKK